MRRLSLRRRGAALILVVVVIAALLAIAAPFVLSMRMAEKSSRGFSAAFQARQLADAGRNAAVDRLLRSHPDEERRARVANNDRQSDPEGVDTHDEVQRLDLSAFSGLHTLAVDDPRGTMVSVKLQDARSRLDLNTAGPHAFANLLGVTVTTQPISYGEEKRIFLEDIGPFLGKDDNDPRTIDGFVAINGEYIAYRHIDRRRRALEGLVRGYFFSRGFGKPPDEPERRTNYHPAGSLVQDGRGYKIAWDPFWRYTGTDREGIMARFDNPAAIRRTADWEFGTLRAALVLSYGYGVDMKRLRQWGITERDLEGAGLQRGYTDRGEPDRSKETVETARLRKEAERKLKTWGVPIDSIRFLNGDKGVIRLYQRLSSLGSTVRDKLIARYRQREEKRKENLGKISRWLKVETKRQMGALTEMRNKASFLETVGRVELEERLRPYLTTDAPPEGEAWSDPQVVNHAVRFSPYSMATRLHIQDTRRFQRWRLVRIQPLPGATNQVPEYRMCWRANNNTVLLFPQLDYDYEANQIQVACRQPRPVNVNTASRWVLRAVLTGLSSRTGQRARARGGQPPNIVTPTQAAAVADALVANGNLTDHAALRALLLELRGSDAIDDHDVDAIYRNAVDSGDPMLRAGTVPFCYRSGDVYELRTAGIVNDAAGNELARHVYRETVRVAPPRTLTWHIDSQDDFTDRLYVNGRNRRRRGSQRGGNQIGFRDSAAFLFRPGRWSNLIQTGPAHLGPYAAVPFAGPSRSHAPGEGDITPLLSREPDLQAGATAQGGIRRGALAPYNPQRNDTRPDGVAISDLQMGAGRVGARYFNTESGASRTVLGPWHMRGWFRFDAIPAAGTKAFLFDGGTEDTIDRISLYLEGPTRMVLEVWGEATDLTEGTALAGGPRPSNRLIYDRPANRPFQRGKWYHVAVFFKGGDRGDLALAIDGQFGGQQTLGSRLAQAIDPFANTLTVEDATGFPPSGWVRVGASRWVAGNNAVDRGLWNTAYDSNNRCEVLHYSSISGNTLTLDQTFNTPVLPAGATPGPIADLDDRSNRVSGLPPTARRPRRGSGHRYRWTYQIPNAQGRMQTRTRDFRAGYAHEAGTLVVPYGYQSWVKNEAVAQGATPQPGQQGRIRRGGATLRQPLPRNTPYTLLYAPLPYVAQDPYPVVLQANQTDIPVFWLEAHAQEQPQPMQAPGTTPPPVDHQTLLKGGFPPFGILRIGEGQTSERIFYAGIDPVGGRFLNCVRGIEGTTARAHRMFEPVVLESIQVSDFRDYPRRNALTDPRQYVSLSWTTPTAAGQETEWLSYQNVQDGGIASRGLVMIPPREDFNGLARFRFRNELNDMRRLGTLVGVNPGLRLRVILPPPPNPLPPNYQAPPITPYVNWPWKELLKREEPSGMRSFRLRIGRRTITLPNPPIEIGSRVAKGTTRPPGDTGHRAGTRVVPTFAIRVEDGFSYANAIITQGAECGSGDLVTLSDDSTAAPQRVEMRVAHAQLGISYNSQALPNNIRRQIQQLISILQARNITIPPGDASAGWLVAFDDFVPREYLGTQNARLSRWPVGNLHTLPNLTFGAARAPTTPGQTVADAPGTLSGRADDVVSEQLTEDIQGRDALLLANALTLGFPAGAGTATSVTGRARSYQPGRLYYADGEVIGVVDAAANGRNRSDLTLQRGALGTTAVNVSKQTALWRLLWPPHAIASGGFGGDRGQFIGIRRPDRLVRFRQGWDGGYLQLTRSGGILPYVGLRNRGRGNSYFWRPVDRFGRGCYAGAFGTNVDGRTPVSPNSGELLIDLPFRHHDRYQDGVLAKDPRLFVDSLNGVFFQASQELPGALIERVEWDELLPDPLCEVKVAVRLDGGPAWNTFPVGAGQPGRRGKVYLFDDPRADNRLMLRADRVEVRVFITWRRTAFQSDAWKEAAKVGAVRVRYRQPVQTIRREERHD